MIMIWLSGCADDATAPPAASVVPLAERMAAPDPGFARALTPRAFEFPTDHGAHPDYATEWWYFTGNLDGDDGRRFGYQLTLFRIGLSPGKPEADSAWRATQMYMGHFAVSDLDTRTHHSSERFARAAAGLAGAEAEPLRVWLGPWSIHAVGSPFPLRLHASTDDFAIDLTVAAGSKPMVLQGDRGLSRKGPEPGNASYYYSYTRLPTTGRIRIEGQTHAVAGASWFDREWSSSALDENQAGWDWFALHLDDGHDLMFYRMRGTDGAMQPYSKGVLVAPDGSREPLTNTDVTLRPTRYWQADDSTQYPVEWRLDIPARDMALRVRAAFDEQEMPHTVRYWEGMVDVSGSHVGRGYLEMSGYAGANAE
jgi:predicted secreted hydrolase